MIVRPRQSILIGLSVAVAFVVGLIVVGALRNGEPSVSWVGVAAALLFLPIVDWYRRTLVVAADGLVMRAFRLRTVLPYSEIEGYGFWKQYVYKSGTWVWLTIVGRGGARIDVPATVCRRKEIAQLLDVLAERAPQARQIVPRRAPRSLRTWLAAAAAVAIVLLSMLVVSVGMPSTLESDRLFSDAAAVGVVVGLALGVVIGAWIVPRAPAAAASATGIVLMTLMPAAAFVYNLRPVPGPMRTTETRVLSSRSYTDRDGKVDYVVDLDVDGTRKRLTPDRRAWERLPAGTTSPACVRKGALGFTLIVHLTQPCAAGAS